MLDFLRADGQNLSMRAQSCRDSYCALCASPASFISSSLSLSDSETVSFDNSCTFFSDFLLLGGGDFCFDFEDFLVLGVVDDMVLFVICLDRRIDELDGEGGELRRESWEFAVGKAKTGRKTLTTCRARAITRASTSGTRSASKSRRGTPRSRKSHAPLSPCALFLHGVKKFQSGRWKLAKCATPTAHAEKRSRRPDHETSKRYAKTNTGRRCEQ